MDIRGAGGRRGLRPGRLDVRLLNTANHLVVDLVGFEISLGVSSASDRLLHPLEALGQLGELDLVTAIALIASGKAIRRVGGTHLLLSGPDRVLCHLEACFGGSESRHCCLHLRVMLKYGFGGCGNPCHQIGATPRDLLHAIPMSLGSVVDSLQPLALIPLVLNRSELRPEALLEISLLLLLFDQLLRRSL